MGGRLRIVILVFCGMLLAPAAFARTEPIYNVVNHPISVPGKKLGTDEVRKNILLGGVKRHWRFEEVAPGEIKATQADAKRQAIISIKYTDAAYSITLLESTGMEQSGDQIGGNYGAWIRLLMQDIDDQLEKASIEAQ